MNKEKGKRILKALPAHILVGLWSVFTIVVIGWIVLASFSTTKEIFTICKRCFAESGKLSDLYGSILYSDYFVLCSSCLCFAALCLQGKSLFAEAHGNWYGDSQCYDYYASDFSSQCNWHDEFQADIDYLVYGYFHTIYYIFFDVLL